MNLFLLSINFINFIFYSFHLLNKLNYKLKEVLYYICALYRRRLSNTIFWWPVVNIKRSILITLKMSWRTSRTFFFLNVLFIIRLFEICTLVKLRSCTYIIIYNFLFFSIYTHSYIVLTNRFSMTFILFRLFFFPHAYVYNCLISHRCVSLYSLNKARVRLGPDRDPRK